MQQVDTAEAVGHIPSGLFIVAVQDTENEIIDGYLASWIQQVSFEPLIVAIAIKPGRPAYDLIKSGKTLTINIVGDHDKSYLKHFWKGYNPEQNPFKELPHHTGAHGGVILDQSKSAIECELLSVTKPGDHEVVFAKVLASYHGAQESKSLVHVRKSGKDY